MMGGSTEMTDKKLLERITVDPRVLVGKAVIKGTRLSVESILNQLAHGATPEGLMAEYGGLTREDIQACLLFASRSLDDTDFMPLMTGTA
jgi:uncharacterized protein (DUF433 family)